MAGFDRIQFFYYVGFMNLSSEIRPIRKKGDSVSPLSQPPAALTAGGIFFGFSLQRN
jgi:hypothetical protein